MAFRIKRLLLWTTLVLVFILSSSGWILWYQQRQRRLRDPLPFKEGKTYVVTTENGGYAKVRLIGEEETEGVVHYQYEWKFLHTAGYVSEGTGILYSKPVVYTKSTDRSHLLIRDTGKTQLILPSDLEIPWFADEGGGYLCPDPDLYSIQVLPAAEYSKPLPNKK